MLEAAGYYTEVYISPILLDIPPFTLYGRSGIITKLSQFLRGEDILMPLSEITV